jgi:predicted transcriptional regulator
MQDYEKNYFKIAKRDKFEIIAAIIAVMQLPSNPTRIMTKANLSYSLLKAYLRLMVNTQLIEKSEIVNGLKKRMTVFQSTEKGDRFLELYCEQLIILHEKHFLEKYDNLAEAYMHQYCLKNRFTPSPRLQLVRKIA